TLASVGLSGISSAASFGGGFGISCRAQKDPADIPLYVGRTLSGPPLCNSKVSPHAADFRPSHRAAPHRRPQLLVAHRRKRVHARVSPRRPWLPGGVSGARG